MKKSIIILLIIIIASSIGIFLSFKLSIRDKDVYVNQTFRLKPHQTAIVKDADNMKITLVSVSDGRCPKDFKCIWAGEITYKFKINSNTLELSTVNNKEEKYENYRIVLGDNNHTKFVNLKVEK